jgi:GDPmannose 4,6-dehydratase
MWLMLQQETPDDYVISTGVSHSVREFVEAAILVAELPGVVEDYVQYDSGQFRPAEVDQLIGDSTKARNILGWSPKVDFMSLVRLMVENDLQLEKR